MGRKVGRPKSGQETLSRERILTAALRLVDEEGVEALSMRRLAVELGVDAMAIYHYLPNKRAVLSEAIAIVFNQLEVPQTKNATWQTQVRAFAKAYCNLARAHSNLVLHSISDAKSAANAALGANEILYSALAAAGLTPQMTIRAADLVVDYLNGFALAERSGRLGQPGEREELLTQLRQHPPEQFPTTHQIFSSLTEDEIRSDFEAGLDIILAGIEASVKQAKSFHKASG